MHFTGISEGVDVANVHGGPAWLERDRYDIRARVPPGTTQADVKFMLRALLAERFHLVIKTGTAPMPTYVLSTLPEKPKMTVSEDTGDGSCTPLPPPQNAPSGAPSYITVKCKNMTMAALADTLHDFAGGYLDQPVVDETNLAGAWDFTIKWTGRGDLQKQGADGISIFTAVEKQLGLKLGLKTAPVFQVASVYEILRPTRPTSLKRFLSRLHLPSKLPSLSQARPTRRSSGALQVVKSRPAPFL